MKGISFMLIFEILVLLLGLLIIYRALRMKKKGIVPSLFVSSFEMKSIRDENIVRFLKKPVADKGFPDGESIKDVMGRTQEFLKELIAKEGDKTYLVSTHACALRAMLNFLYNDPDDYWHGHVPYNCCVNIIDVKDGAAELIADDKIYYDREMAVDWYK